MREFVVGAAIKTRRESLFLSQRELCEGICSVPTLSRIENSTQLPSLYTYYSLLERLGMSKYIADYYIGKKDYERFNLMKLARLYTKHETIDTAYEYVVKLRSMGRLAKDQIQQCNAIEAVYLRCKGKIDYAEELSRNEDYLRISCPSYTKTKLPRLMSFSELYLLNGIACNSFFIGDSATAFRIFYHMWDFHKDIIEDTYQYSSTISSLLYNLSKFIGLSGDYDKCIEICSSAIEEGIKYKRSKALSGCYYNMAWCLVRRKKPGDMERAEQAILKAYYIAEPDKYSENSLHLYRHFISKYFPDLNI